MKIIKQTILTIITLFPFLFTYGQNDCFSLRANRSKDSIVRIDIDSTFYASSIVCSISNNSFSGLSVTANVKLYNYESYVRILLYDLDDGQENYAYETNLLYNISNAIVKVEIHNGECQIDNISYSPSLYSLDRNLFDKEKSQLKLIQDSIIIASLNQRLRNESSLWFAGVTSISKLYYDQRKDILPKNTENETPNLQGFEYYIGGVFEILTDSARNYSNCESAYVDEFDWRNRHGENWITPVKNQSCNHCWVFCPTSVAESSMNLFYNQHIDYDLSEQHLASCSSGNLGECSGGRIAQSVHFLATQGVVNEDCFPYLGGDSGSVPCFSGCHNPTERISFNSYSSITNYVDNIKKAIILHGPICGGVSNLWHYMSIIGFKTLNEGDVVYNGTSNYHYTIQSNNPYIGQTCWLFKNSFGIEWGEEGCAYVVTDLSNLYGLFSLHTPESYIYEDNNILCEDKDGDGYYYWGIGPKPATCPNCPDEPDCDDSDPFKGPYGDDYSCISLCDMTNSPTPINISESETWNTSKHIDGDIEILSSATLTITNIIRLSSQSKIVVHPGAKLIVDGGILTNLCPNSMWPGIEVWGNSAAHQYPDASGHYAQGYVELKNGAVIENAECALALWRPNHWGTTGGIVHADNATFRNCAKAVHALHYTNHSPINGSELPYNSRFRNCTFAIDEDYLGTSTFYKHIDLDEVNGIGFTGCDFSVVRSVGGVSPWCAGIAAHSAGFSVMAYCDNGNSQPETCPEPQLRRSTFTGFHRGIHASNDGSAARTFTVRDAVFANNTCGIHALNTGFATVIGCDFTVGCGSDCDFGIYAVHVTGFCIEENTFRPKQHCTGAPYGILIADSEGSNDIYRNTFNGLLCGNVAVGANHHADPNAGGRIRRAGLTYTCNANSGNQADFLVLDNGGTLAGIQPQQGSAAKPAGNTFSDGRWHLHNGGDIQVTYYYSNADPAQAPDSAKLHNASAVATTNANTCPSHYGGGSVVKSAAEKAALAEDYTSASTVHESLARIYDSKLDGGSTPAETADINAAAPSDLWRLRAKLLGHSPYLSQEALTAAADRHDVFPESVLFEILAANPDELKKDTLIRYMENKANPLPQYMTDLLRQMASGTTARTALLAQMGRYAHERDLAAGDIVRSNLNDTLADHAELRAWLGNMESLAADRLAVASFVQQGDFGSALALAESLPELYGLQGGELNDHNDYMSLLSLYQTLYGEGRNTLQLTEAEAAMVEGIAENGQGASRAMAEALLQGRSDNRVPALSCPTIPEANGGRGNAASPDPSLLNKALGFSASISPNPANTWAAIDYTLPVGASKATLTLTNALGVAVMTAELNGNQGQKVLDLRPLAAGVYGYSVRCREHVMNGKIVVTK